MADVRSALFEPVRIGGIDIPNRIAMAPMTREFSPGGVPGKNVADYYARRAEAGTGLIITEGVAVDAVGAHDGPIPLLFQLSTQHALAGVVAAVHAHGARIFAQLWHVGVQDTLTVVNPDTIKRPIRRRGPSGLSGTGQPLGDALTEAQIDETIQAFARAAEAAQTAGFDGVEIHGAHGYLPDQFIWAKTNRRDDRYGGDQTARLSFVIELIRACRAAVGPDFPIVLRLSQWKSFDYAARLAHTPQELAAIVEPLAEAGVDAFHGSTRRFWEPEFEGSELNFAGWLRKLSGKPTISVGSVTLQADFKAGIAQNQGGISASEIRHEDIDRVAAMIESGEFDMIAVGRAMISNPDWTRLVREGRLGDLRPYTREHLASLH